MSEPRRLHPATMVLDTIRGAPSTLLGIPAVLAISGRGAVLALSVMGALAIGSLVLAWLRWRRFTYAIEGDALVIEHGLLNRSRRSIPLERIQDVSIEQGLLARLFGIATVKVETGGSDKDEGTLGGVSLAEAARLRAMLRGHAAEAVAQSAPTEASALFAMGLGRVLFSGLFNFSLVWIAAIIGVFQTANQFIDFDVREWTGIAEEQVEHFSIALLASLVVIAIGLGVIAGVLRTVARDYSFRLMHSPGRFRRVRGLLTRSEVVIADSRIQLALIRHGAISGRFGWRSVEFQTLGGSDDVSGRQQAAPFASAEESGRVIHASGLPAFERAGLEPVACAHGIRGAIRKGLFVATVFGTAGWFLHGLWFGLLLVPVVAGVALLQRRGHRFALRDTGLQIMRGVVVRREWIVPDAGVQVVTIKRGLLQRLLGVVTVSVDTAGAGGGNRPDVVDIARANAAALAAGLIVRC